MTTTEDRLRAALDAWATTVESTPDAWERQQRRLHRQRYHRVASAVAFTAAVALVVAGLGVGLRSGDSNRTTGHRPTPTIPPLHIMTDDPQPTSAVVPVGSIGGIGFFYVYWAHGKVCEVQRGTDGFGTSVACEHFPPTTDHIALSETRYAAELAVAVVRDDVASVMVRTTPAGTELPARLVDGKGFPARLAVVVDRRLGPDDRWHAYDAGGLPMPTNQPFELDIRQVLASWLGPECSRPHPNFHGEIVPGPNGDSCYGLAWSEIRMRHTASAEAGLNGQTNEWEVDVQLDRADAQRFAAVTGQVAGQKEPRDELAFILDGTFFQAPSIVEQIRSGRLVLFGLDERRARELAAELSGG
jgi:hypothetical protein